MSVNVKLTAIADEIRTLTGTTGTMGLDAMAVHLGDVNDDVAAAYTAASEKGATMPDTRNSENLVSTIQSISAGSSGTELNFEVVGGTAQPINPTENTIWVNTEEEITGWTFSATEPENPAQGHVWIIIGSASQVSFNALKENDIQVYPLSAKQYDDNTWVNVTCASYQDSAWVEWIPTSALYYFGNQCVLTSGGWNARGWRYDSTYSGTVVPNITYNADHMEITVPNSNTSGGVVEVVKDQDFTNVNNVTIDFEVPSIIGYKIILIVIKRTATYLSDAVCSIELATQTDGQVLRKTVTLDTSGVSGAYDLAIRFSDHWTAATGTVTMKVYSVMKE